MLSPYASITLPLRPSQGIRSGSERGVVIRVITSSLSTLLSAENASSVKVVKPTSAARVCTSPLRSEGSPAENIPSPCYSGSRADARQNFSIHC